MFWLGLDFETTGLDTSKERITEVGAVLWDCKEKLPLSMFNALIFDETMPELTPEITALTGLKTETLKRWGSDPKEILQTLTGLMAHADYIVAHNGTNFDKPLYYAECKRWGVTPCEKPWIDSCADVPYDARIATRKLVHLAAEHNFLNPFAHRAVFDVLTMFKVISQYDHDEIIRYANSPNITVRAVVTYEDRLKASSRGYRWNADAKHWIKTIKNFQIEKETKECPFKVVQIEERGANG
jgi:DNA polymerase-3 subunit epsilon